MGSPDAAAKVEVDRWYRDMRSDLVRLALLLSGSREAAEDAVQAVFLDAQSRWDQIKDHRACLRRAVFNRVKDMQRRILRRRTVTTGEQIATGIPEVDETWSAICRLSRRQRDVVVLRFYEDLSMVEIAELLGRNQATASTRRRCHRRSHRWPPRTHR
jgi:RNA polymerase sigma factor (sigma-70 family)